MRNLVPVLRGRVLAEDYVPWSIEAISVDGDVLFFVFRNDSQVALHTWTAGKWTEWPSFEQIAPLQCIMAEDDACVMLFTSGDVVEVRHDAAEAVGSLDEDVLASSWSPDHELLCVVTASKVVLMSRLYDTISEYPTMPADLKLSKHVSVGWGKRETQFQGRGARAQRDPTMPEHVDTGIISDTDTNEVSVSWRGDGEFFAVNSVEVTADGDDDSNDAGGRRRVVRVFTRAGVLSNVTVPIDYMGSLLAWQPSGAFIASAKPGAVLFFERNGLERPAFKLESEEIPESLSWSPDSDILAVTFKDRIELWATRNWHWYHKQTIVTAAKNVQWHPEQPLTLLVNTGNTLDTHNFVWLTAEHEGTVAVIDGSLIKITDLSVATIPPPMSQWELPVASQPVHVAVGNELLVVAFMWGYETYSLPSLKSTDSVKIPGLLQTALEGSIIHTLSTCGSRTYLDGAEMSSTVIHIRPQGYLTAKGDAFDWNHKYLATTGPCVDIWISDRWVFALRKTGQLVAADTTGQHSLGYGITSLRLFGDILLATTANQLKFAHVNNEDDGEGENVPVLPDDNATTEQCRELDRGSVVISVLAQRMAVVLQAPRGNIELIHPRLLVVGSIRTAIREGRYGDAFTACRSHRVDLNLLYDLDPAQFEDRVTEILRQIGSPQNLDLFLSSLTDVDITLTKYVDTLRLERQGTNTNSEPLSSSRPGKVNKLMELLLPYLPLQSKLTALALKRPPELGRALALADKDDSAVRHLGLLVEPLELYRTALSLYDLHLALTVAEHAQMDPKDYLAFLRAREVETPNRRKFSIDDHLHNYGKALLHLLKAETPPSVDEVLMYVTVHGLWEEAVAAIGPQPHESELGLRLLEAEADHWMAESHYAKAGRVYESLGLEDKAFRAYVSALDWRAALCVRPGSAAEVRDGLVSQRHWGDAADVAVGWTGDYAEAIQWYCQGGRYSDAVMVARHYLPETANDVLDKPLRESFGSTQELLSDCSSQIQSQLRRLREVRAKRHADALNYGVADDGIPDNISIAGTETTNAASYVTRYTDKSSGTLKTGASRRTARNKRRDERKRARGKRGTVYEEDYLIASMGRLVERLIQTKPDTQQLVWVMSRSPQMRIYSLQIMSAWAGCITMLRENIEEVYDVSDEDLERFDEDGVRFVVERPVPPSIPDELEW